MTAIVALGPTMPATEPKHFQRMPKWTRFVYANARYAPRVLPYVTMAFFQCIRRLGPRRFMQTVMAKSEADLKVLADDETLTAMLRGRRSRSAHGSPPNRLGRGGHLQLRGRLE